MLLFWWYLFAEKKFFASRSKGVLEITLFCLFRLVSPPVSGHCIPNSFPTEFWLSANSLNFSILPFMKKKNPPSCTAATADRMRSASRHRNLPNKKRSFLLPESDPINFRDSSSSSSSPSSSSGVSYSNADMMEEEKVLQQLHERTTTGNSTQATISYK